METKVLAVNPMDLILSDSSMGAIFKMGELMAGCKATMPDHLRGNTGDCVAIVMQAHQWGMNPFAVAQKTHLVNGTLGYESQLVNAVISSSTAVQGRFKYKAVGDWSQVAKKGWGLAEEKGLGVQVGAFLAGDDEITWGETVWLATVGTRNSPLWKTAPYQQLCYLSLKYWSRLYTPDVLLGVYDKEDIEQPSERKEREINPAQHKASDLNTMFSDTKKEAPKKQAAAEPEFIPKEENNAPTQFQLIKDHISSVVDAQGYGEAAAMYNKALEQKSCSVDDLNALLALLNALHAKLSA